MWNTLVNINSVFFTCACTYTIFAAGASIYFLTIQPLAIGIAISFILLITEVVFSALDG